MADDEAAAQGRNGATKRARSKSQGGEATKQAKPKKLEQELGGKPRRVQLHIGAQTMQRLGVHCALLERNPSKEANRILLMYLSERGRGRQQFKELKVEDPPTTQEESVESEG